MDWVPGQLWIGDMALHALHGKSPAHRATAAILDHVSGSRYRRGLTHNAPVETLAASRNRFADSNRSIRRRAFFIAGQQKGDGESRLATGGDQLFTGDYHCRDGSLHVGSASAVKLALTNDWGERIARPLIYRARRHHVRVSREDEHPCARRVAASDSPEVADAERVGALVQAFAIKTERHKPRGNQVQTAGVLWGDRRACNQLLGEFECA